MVDDSSNQKALVLITMAGREVWSTAVPKRGRLWIEIDREHPELVLTDSEGESYVHNLTSILDENLAWIYLAVQVSEQPACYAYAVLAEKKLHAPIKALTDMDAKGLIFQPFFLPESGISQSKFNGKGVFHRGFLTPGYTTSSNYSLSCICDECRNSFRVQSFDTWGEECYFYCDSGLHTFVIDFNRDSSEFVQDAPVPLADPDWDKLRDLESRLPTCRTCGGKFAYMNPFRCPHCSAPYIDFKSFPETRRGEYRGCHLYGDRVQTLRDV